MQHFTDIKKQDAEIVGPIEFWETYFQLSNAIKILLATTIDNSFSYIHTVISNQLLDQYDPIKPLDLTMLYVHGHAKNLVALREPETIQKLQLTLLLFSSQFS